MGPLPLNFIQWLRANAMTDGHRVAVIDRSVSLTYAELDEAVRSVAGAIRASGLKPKQPVGLALEPSVSYLVLLLGALDAGVVPTFINTRLAPPEVKAFVERIQPQAVIHDAANKGLVRLVDVPLIEVPGWQNGDTVPEQLASLYGTPGEPYFPDEDDPAVIFPTGGTTGLPKGCYTSHRQLLLWAWNVATTTRRHRHQTELFFAPFFHVSLVVGVLAPLFSASTIVIEPAFDADAMLEAIAKHGATRMQGAPTVYTAMMRAAGDDLSIFEGIEDIIFGSTSSTDAFAQQLLHAFPNADITSGYGATEFASGVSRIGATEFRSGRIDGVGRPNPGCEIVILDPDGNRLPAGEAGEIAVRSPWQTLGYWNQPEETAATYGPDGFIRLGDIGYFSADNWLYVSGRLKEMIITGGENVFPIEVEQVINNCPGVMQAVAFGVPDDYWGERIEAVVTTFPGADVSSEQLTARLREHLAAYKVPKAIHIIDELPLTPNSKPDRLALRRMYGDRQSQASR